MVCVVKMLRSSQYEEEDSVCVGVWMVLGLSCVSEFVITSSCHLIHVNCT